MVREVPHFTPTLPDVSVLMVVHDAERSVRRAIESIQNQTLKNIELIIVDAGSTDSTPRQLEALAERDLRLDVVRADECGRLEGLDLALERSRGSYVAILDQNGWARPTMLASLVERARDKNLELVIGGYALDLAERGARFAERVVDAGDTSYLTQHDFRADAWRLFSSGQLLPASAKLFSREAIEGSRARFSAGMGTDHGFTLSVLRDVEKVGVVAGECYRLDRLVRASALQGGIPVSFRSLEAEHTALLGLYRHWGLDGDAASMEMLQNRYVERLVGCVEEICLTPSRLGGAQQRDAVARMLGSEYARLAVSVARPRSNHVRSMLVPMRAQNVSLVCAQARLLSLLRRGQSLDVPADVFI